MLFEIRLIYNWYSLLIDFITNHRKYEHLFSIKPQDLHSFLKAKHDMKIGTRTWVPVYNTSILLYLIAHLEFMVVAYCKQGNFCPFCSCVWKRRRQKLHKNSPVYSITLYFLHGLIFGVLFFFYSLFYMHLFVMYWPVYLMFHFTWLWINA